MRNRELLYTVAVLFLSVFAINDIAASDRPNILWIITDDQRADALECYNRAVTGQSESPLGFVMSPSLDSLAAEGVLFTNSFCNSPGCAPSRASMHMGRYPHRGGIYGFEYHHDGPSFVQPFVPQVMKSQGYNTVRFGKLGVRASHRLPNGSEEDNDFYGLEIDQKDLQEAKRTDFYGHTYYNTNPWTRIGRKDEWFYPDGSMRSYWTDREDGIMPEGNEEERKAVIAEQDVVYSYTRSNPDLILAGVSSQPANRTLDARITQSFQDFLSNADQEYTTIDGQAAAGPDTDEPQFIHLGYHFPHTPVLPPRSFRDKFRGKIYRVPEFTGAELGKLPAQLKKMYDQMKIHPMSYDEKQAIIRDYYAFCAFGDSLIGAAVRSFQEYCQQQGQEYLVVIALGDHGWHLGEQGISAKFAPYEQSNRTATIVISSDKQKFPADHIEDSYLEFVDFAPTFFAAAGIDLSTETYEYLDGYDLAAVVSGAKAPRQYVLGEQNQVAGDRAYIRSHDFAFSMKARKVSAKPNAGNLNAHVTWPLTCSRYDAELALFDLRADPGEHNNVAYDAAYIELADWFRTKLGNIVLGDGRIECDWESNDLWNISNFAEGADDKLLEIPDSIVPGLAEVEIVLTGLSLGSGDAVIGQGKQVYLSPSFSPFTAHNKELVWESSDTNILKVDMGIVSALDTGNATITAISVNDSTVRAAVNFSVNEPLLPTVEILQDTLFLTESKPEGSFSVTTTPQAAAVFWKSSNTAVAEVDANGRVSAKDNGEALIISSFWYEGLTYSDTSLAVCRIYDPMISFFKDTILFNIFHTREVLELETVPPRMSITWESNDPSIAYVVNGLVIASTSGTTEVIASFTHQSITYYDTIRVIVDFSVNTGINNTHGNRVRIHPNPTGGTFEIQSETGIDRVMISDINGKLLRRIDVPENNIVDISDLERGIYLVHLRIESEMFVRRIIIAR